MDRLESLVEEQAAELIRLRSQVESRDLGPMFLPTTAPAPLKSPIAYDASVERLDTRRVPRTMDPFAQTSPGVRWGGYLTLEYVAPSNRNSWFDLHRLILQADAQILPGIDFLTEIEFEHGGIGGALDGDVKIEYAEVTFRLCDALQPKVGAILIPFGRYNLAHDDPLNDFTKRPWVARYLVPTGFSQPGIGAEGAFRLGCEGILTYDVALTTGYDDGFSTSGGVRGARQAWNGDNNENKQVWGRVAYDPGQSFLDFLEVGASGTYGRYDDSDDQAITGFGLDLLARKGPFEFQGEYLRYDLERGAADPADAARSIEGLWLQAGVHFLPPFLCGCRNVFVTDTSSFTLALRYQWQDLNDRVHGGALFDDASSWGVALAWRITEGTVFRVDHTWIDAASEGDVQEFTASFSTYF